MNIEKGEANRKSAVWKYFTKHDNISARCKLCTKILKHGGNTTNLMQHLHRKHTLHLHCNNSSQCCETSVRQNDNSTISEQTSIDKALRVNRVCEEDMDMDDPNIPSCSQKYDTSATLKRKVSYEKSNLYVISKFLIYLSNLIILKNLFHLFIYSFI